MNTSSTSALQRPASQAAAGKHVSVLKAATELFVRVADPDPMTKLQYEELSLRLLPKCPMMIRSEIAELLCQTNAIPHAVAMALACDDIAVAAPVLRYYEEFNSDDLLIIMANTDKFHDLVIAGRTDLDEKVEEALKRRADKDLELLASGAVDSEAEAKQIEEAQHIENEERLAIIEAQLDEEFARLDLLTDEIEEEETPEAETLETVEETSDEPKTGARHVITLDRFLTMETAHCLTTLASYEAYARQNGLSAHKVLSDALTRAEDARVLTSMVKSKDHSRIVPYLSDRLDLSLEQITRIILDENGFALAVLAKALSLPPETANMFFLLLNEAIGKSHEQFYFLDWLYGQFSPAAARNVVADWSGVVAEKPRHAPISNPDQPAADRGSERRQKTPASASAFAQKVARSRARGI